MLPCDVGLSLKPMHFDAALATAPRNRWYEVHPENYLVDGGPLLDGLRRIREDHALSLHSVGMSPGSLDGIDVAHVRRIRALCERFEPALVSDHLAWSRWQGMCLNDLLPLPCTADTLDIVCRNVMQIQELLGRRIAIENPSLYLALTESDMPEWEFLGELARRSGCGLLLDINNLVVNANNVALDPVHYLQALPADAVLEYHLAGHKREAVGNAVLCIDDHGSPVPAAVWRLYDYALRVIGARPTLIEWDTDVPAYSTLETQAQQAATRLAVACQTEVQDA